MNKTFELAILMVAILLASHLGTFLLADRVNADEFQKLGMGSMAVGAVLAAYKLFTRQKEE